MVFFPQVWALIESFKGKCGGKGWTIFGNEDLVNVGDEYHYFVWTRHIHPGTFRRVTSFNRKIPISDSITRWIEEGSVTSLNGKILIREGSLYTPVSISYMAWISPESIGEDISEILLEDPELSRKVAVYDLSPVYEGRSICLRLNETASIVFREFERFLSEEYKISFKPLRRPEAAISSF